MNPTPRQGLRLVLLRTFARLTRAPGAEHPAAAGAVRRILVIRPDHLGDMLFATPALRALRERHPGAHVTALVGPWGAPVLAGNLHVDEIVSLPYPGFSRQPKPSPWQPYAVLKEWAARLRDRYDLALVLRFDHWWGALLAYLAGIPWRVGYDVAEVAPFLSHPLPYRPGQHEVCQNLRLVNVDWGDRSGAAEAGEPPCSPWRYPLEFFVPEQAQAWASGALPVRPLIAIHPGAGAPVKLWPVAGWAAVADALAEDTGAQVLLTGSAGERSLCVEVAERMKTTPRVMAGETSLDRLAALFTRCRLVLGVDSGPLHLAVAVGTPTVHLYGPVDTATFGVWGPGEKHQVLVSAWPCIPCNRLDYRLHELKHHPCVREIRVEAVLAAARQALRA